MKSNTYSAGSKPALRHIKVFQTEHENIMKNVSLLEMEYFKRAQALGIPIRKKGKFRNTPGQAEAMEYFFAGISMSEYIEKLIERAVGIPSNEDWEQFTTFAEKIHRKAELQQGAQA